MEEKALIAHLGAAHAGWWVAHRLLVFMAEKSLITPSDAIQILGEGAEALAEGGPTNRAAALLLEQVKTDMQKAGGLRSH